MNSPVKMLTAMAVLALAFAVPFGVGLAGIWRTPALSERAEWVAVTTLDSLPAEGVPHRFPVSVPQFDAWNRLPDRVVGFVFLRRAGGMEEVLGLRTTYHMGCIVKYNASARRFEVPCRKDVWFDLDGRRLHSVAEWGDLPSVRTEVRGDVVYVNLENIAR